MWTYLRGRILQSALPLVAVVLGVFILARLTGDPSSLYLPLNATEQMKADFSQRYGLDQPIWVQLGSYVAGIARFDFGESMRTGESAAAMVLRAFPATLQLAGVTMGLAVVISALVGCWAALKPNGVADRVASFTSMTAASVPDFWLAILGIWVFAIWLGILPTSGTVGAAAWVLPVGVLLMRPVGVLTQVVRGSMVTALGQPYVKVARSKGAGQFYIVTRHALRNAAAPALTVAGDLAVGYINGAVVIESIFGWPGIGKLMIDSIMTRDFPVLQAAVLLTAIAIFALNIVIDVLYAVIDPRVRPAARRRRSNPPPQPTPPAPGTSEKEPARV